MPKVHDFIINGARDGVTMTNTTENRTIFVPYQHLLDVVTVMQAEMLDRQGANQ